jgi:TldD protein
VRAHLAAAARASQSSFTEIRFERRRGTAILQRGSEMVYAADTESAGGVVRCYNPGCGWGVASFRTLDDLRGALRNASESSLVLRGHRAQPLPPVPAREMDLDCPAARDPSRVPLTRKIELASLVSRTMRGPDRRVVSTRTHYQDALHETIVVTSEGLSLRESRPQFSLAAIAVAEEAGTVERAAGSIASAGHWNELEEWSRTAWQLGERAVMQLHAPPVRAGRYPVVLDPAAAGLLAHRAVGHLCEADADGPGPLPFGARLGGELVTIGDDGSAIGRRGTAAFDHEGMRPVPTILVQHGVVVGHVHTRMSAARAGTGPTGTARGGEREPPRARLSNTYVASGRGDLADLLNGISVGVYVADPVGATLDDSRTGLRAGLARMIRNGELAEPVKGVVLEADPLALLGLVDRVAGDFSWSTAALSCDRGSAGTLPVSTGAPHVRLIETTVGELA